jgi:hypothetical protein
METVIESIKEKGYLSMEDFSQIVEINKDHATIICNICCRPNDFDMLHYFLESGKIYGSVLDKILTALTTNQEN